MLPKELIGLRLALVPILIGWEKVCVRARGADPIDADTVEIYAESLAEIKVTPEELESARRAMLRTSKFFPAISDIVTYVTDHRDSNPYRGWICCEDADGLPWVAPPHQVLDGIYRPDGSGNGRPLPPREEREGDKEKVDRLLNAPSGRMPLALGVRSIPGAARNVHEREPIGPEKVAELEDEARRTYDRRRNGA